jgi:hypothetical protein
MQLPLPQVLLLSNTRVWLHMVIIIQYQGDGGSKNLWQVGEHLWDYTEQYSRRLSSSAIWFLEIWITYLDT